METMPEGKEWCTHTPHFEGDKVFGSTAHQLSLPLGSQFDSHRPDKMNFSRRRVQRTTREGHRGCAPTAIDLSSLSSPTSSDGVRILSPPPSASTIIGVHVKHVTSVEESDCDASQWHIARLQKTSKKKCFAKQARTGRTCSEMIVHLGKSTPAPTYTGMLHIRRQLKDKVMEFFHYMDDIERCVKGTNQKWVVGTQTPVPSMWPVLRGTKLTKGEILRLEQAGFELAKRREISLRRLFGHSGSNSADVAALPTPLAPDAFPTLRDGRCIRRLPEGKVSVKQRNRWESAAILDARISQVTPIPYPVNGGIVLLHCKKAQRTIEYRLTIGTTPDCSCEDFKDMFVRTKKRGAWYYCKHLYYIFRVLCQFQLADDHFVHAPTFSFNKVKKVIDRGVGRFLY